MPGRIGIVFDDLHRARKSTVKTAIPLALMTTLSVPVYGRGIFVVAPDKPQPRKVLGV
jgi:hypothetical protein